MKRKKHDLQDLPNSSSYYESWMHLSPIKYVFMYHDLLNILCTISIDGILQLWALPKIEFIKKMQMHSGITDASINKETIISIYAREGEGTTNVKLTNLTTLDVFLSIDIKKPYSHCVKSLYNIILASTNIDIYSLDGDFLNSISIHEHQISCLLYSQPLDVILACDISGTIGVYSTMPPHQPANLHWKMKLKTDLYLLNKLKTHATAAVTSNDGQICAFVCMDQHVRVFDLMSGKCLMDVLVDCDVKSQCAFDHSDHYLFIPTNKNGIICTVIKQSKDLEIIREYGKSDGVHFNKIAIHQHIKADLTFELATSNNPTLHDMLTIDPVLIGIANNRFYVFNNSDPLQEDRNHENEKQIEPEPVPNKSELINVPKILPKFVILHTSQGDITIQLYGDYAPKMVYNFTELIKRGYYKNMTWHRIVKGFMIQTGDPNGDGTGGASIYGEPFKDEIGLRHDAYSVSMANNGKDLNTSQFFITVRECSWLNEKNSVFGKVIDGIDTVHAINDMETDENDMPKQRIKLIDCTISEAKKTKK